MIKHFIVAQVDYADGATSRNVESVIDDESEAVLYAEELEKSMNDNKTDNVTQVLVFVERKDV
ncbi:MAG: hypothetical protein MJZ20_01405 [Bacteroidaceae bacterium]|nr:hypothetical protein [Bacteroidaceae bacterium]